jgi:pimeloyl-ACP methyl ester carboxylesterase
VGTFASYDGTPLAYHVEGSGDALVCLPGGPARASRYLGDLGGLSAYRTLVRLDSRGSGDSALPADPATYRCDRLVDDVEALRVHLGMERMDLLAHSAGANVALLYAARHPARVSRLVLVTPSLRAAGIEITEDEWLDALARLSDQPWYDDANAAVMAMDAGDDAPEVRSRAAPFFYGRWNETVAAHAAGQSDERAPDAAAGFAADGAFEPEMTRRVLAGLAAPVLVIAGGLDPAPSPARAAELAALFPRGEVAVDETAAHYPWVTGADAFVATVEAFLARPEALPEERRVVSEVIVES